MWRAVTFDRLGIVLRDALAAFVRDAEVVLSRGIPCSAALRYYFTAST